MNPNELALKRTAEHLRMFARNGRWGTCTDCPRDLERNAYPEFCEHTDRSDALINEIEKLTLTNHP